MRYALPFLLAALAVLPARAQDEGEVFELVEQEPELIGGIEALQRAVEYPEMARRAGVEGTVFVQFVVDEQGRVSEAVCARTPNQMLCDASIQAVQASAFRPGMHRGRPVKVRFTVPIRFKLNDPDEASPAIPGRPAPPAPPPPPPVRSPLAYAFENIGEPWNAARAAYEAGPPRAGSIVKNGFGTVVYDSPTPIVETLTVVITAGRIQSAEARFMGEEGATVLGQILTQQIELTGAPADNGSFSPEQLGEPVRLTIRPRAGIFRLEAAPAPARLGTEAEVPEEEIIEIYEIDLDEARPPPPTMPALPGESEAEIFEVVEQDPVLIGGMEWLETRAGAFRGLVERPAIVWVQVVVTEQGGVTDAVCVRTPEPALCEPALRIVRTARFEPGRQRGRVVRVRYTLPVRFEP